MTTEIHFAIPGDLHTLTGGYAYDRRLIAGLEQLGLAVKVLPLSGQFPRPDAAALAEAGERFAALPEGAMVLADGLAFGALAGIAEHHGRRLRIIALCHHPLALESGLSSPESKRLRDSETRALKAARSVVVTSPFTARLLVRHFAVPQAKITVAQPGTERQSFAPCAGNPPVLLTVATLTPRKAHDLLIDALAQVRHLPWVARFVGGGHFDPDWAAQLRDRVRVRGLERRISFVGELGELGAEYRNADIFVLPSRFEGYGMVFAEALSHGLPVIAARAGAVADLVPESAGLLVPVDDLDALAGGLGTLLQDRVRFQQLQRGARQAALQLPSWDETAGIVAKLIRETAPEAKQSSEPGGFSVAWLDLREGADSAARDRVLAERARLWVGKADAGARPLIVDLGAGTGSTLRALASRGFTGFAWRLVDRDTALLKEARQRHGSAAAVEICQGDLMAVSSLPLAGARLVSASALFDLVSRAVVERLADRLAQSGTGFYAALNYDGRTEWNPPHPLDPEVLAAFNRDQQRDKGTGPALGPDSGSSLQTAFARRGYVVWRADSPWRLGPGQQKMLEQLTEGIAAAVASDKALDADALQAWKSFRLAHAGSGTCLVGHVDVLALPPV